MRLLALVGQAGQDVGALDLDVDEPADVRVGLGDEVEDLAGRAVEAAGEAAKLAGRADFQRLR